MANSEHETTGSTELTALVDSGSSSRVEVPLLEWKYLFFRYCIATGLTLSPLSIGQQRSTMAYMCEIERNAINLKPGNKLTSS